MKIVNKKSFGVLFFSFTMWCSIGLPNTVNGEITQNHSRIKYSVDLERGSYALNFSNAFNFKIQISKQELKKVSCEKEKAVVNALAGQGSNKLYKMGRVPVKFDIVSSDLNMDLDQIKKEIYSDLNSRGYKVKNLNSTTKFFITKLTPIFEWSDKSLTKNARKLLSSEANEILLNGINLPDEYERLHLAGKESVVMPFHTVICDLLDRDLKIYFNAIIEVVNDTKNDPILSEKQLLNLNSELMSNSSLLEKANSENTVAFDFQTKKIIHSAGALAFALAKQGFDSSFLEKNYFDFIFDKMFNNSTLMPRKLSNSDLIDLKSELSNEIRTHDDSIKISNKELKVEVTE